MSIGKKIARFFKHCFGCIEVGTDLAGKILPLGAAGTAVEGTAGAIKNFADRFDDSSVSSADRKYSIGNDSEYSNPEEAEISKIKDLNARVKNLSEDNQDNAANVLVNEISQVLQSMLESAPQQQAAYELMHKLHQISLQNTVPDTTKAAIEGILNDMLEHQISITNSNNLNQSVSNVLADSAQQVQQQIIGDNTKTHADSII